MKAFSLKRAFWVSTALFAVGFATVKLRKKKPTEAPKQAKDDKILFV